MSEFPVSLDVVAIKATVVLVGAMLVAYALRRASGSSRHTLWTATTLALLALPLLHSNLPRLSLDWLPASAMMEQASGSPDVALTVSGAGLAPAAVDQLIDISGSSTATANTVTSRGVGFWIGVTWLLGAIGFAMPVLLGVMRSRRVMARAIDVDDDRLRDHFVHASRLVGVATPVALRISPEVRTPMTGGIMHPVVLLPESATMWSDECLASVLRHELVHVRQRDALRQLGSRLSVALYWFHPLAWRAARLGALAREVACDESVLRLGTRPSRYARHLLALADPLPAPMAPALVRLDHPHLEERVMAILRASPPPASRRLSITAALLIFSWTAAVAAAAPGVRDAAAEVPRTGSENPVGLAALSPELELPALEALPKLTALSPLQVPVADCEMDRDSRTRAVSGSESPVRMFTTEVEGTRICATIRGDNQDRETFLPRGRLANGVVLTLGSSNDDGTRRLEILGTDRGNQHRWYVDGNSAQFDTDAAEWRDAMFNLIGTLSARSTADRREALIVAGRAREEMMAARSSGVAVAGRLAEVERHAEGRARLAEEVAVAAESRVHAREAAVGRAVESAHRAERVARQFEEERAVAAVGRNTAGTVRPRVAVGAPVAPEPPRAAGNLLHERERVALQRHELEERRALMREHAGELREHAEELERNRVQLRREMEHTAPRMAEGRAGAVMAAPRAVPGRREAELDAAARNASERLRRAIRET